MKITVTQKHLSEAFGMAAPFLNGRVQHLPILTQILVKAEADTLHFFATDLEVGLRYSIPAEVESPGTFTLPGKKFLDLVKRLDDKPVTFSMAGKDDVAVKSGKTSYKLPTLAADSFPSIIPERLPETWLTVPASQVLAMLDQTDYAMSHDESRYALNGIKVEVNGSFRMIATDGHRMAMSTTKIPEGAPQMAGIVARGAVEQIAKLLKGHSSIEICLTDNQFLLRTPKAFLVSRLIEGTFPNYEQVIPKNHPVCLTLAKDEFSSSLRRISRISEERTKPIKLTLTAGSMVLSAHSPDFGSGEETIPVSYDGGDLTIGFNCNFLLEALAAQPGAEVEFHLRDGISPGVIKAGDALCVVMPMRL